MSLKNIVLAVAIAVLTFLVVLYGINTFYSTPEYNNYCNNTQQTEFITSNETCNANGGFWNYYTVPVKSNETNGYCDTNYYCSQSFNKAQEAWNKNLFFFGLPLGLIIIILGAFLFSLEFVGAGLMWGGVATIIYSTAGFFAQSADWIKFTISIIALIIIISFAYWYNNKIKKQILEIKKVSTKKKSSKKKVKRR